MSATMTTLGIDRMSIDDRLRLVGEIWDSIAAEAGALPLTDAEKETIDQRLADMEANPKRRVGFGGSYRPALPEALAIGADVPPDFRILNIEVRPTHPEGRLAGSVVEGLL
jgi:putative addiction module component (TIGR02574 family)